MKSCDKKIIKEAEEGWEYSIPTPVANKLRRAVEEGNIKDVIDALKLGYQYIHENIEGAIKDDAYEDTIWDLEVIAEDDPDDESAPDIDNHLESFFALCDDLDVFIPPLQQEEKGVVEEEPVKGNLKESLHGGEIEEFIELAKEIGLKDLSDVERFLTDQHQEGESEIETLRRYRDELGSDFHIKEGLKESHSGCDDERCEESEHCEDELDDIDEEFSDDLDECGLLEGLDDCDDDEQCDMNEFIDKNVKMKSLDDCDDIKLISDEQLEECEAKAGDELKPGQKVESWDEVKNCECNRGEVTPNTIPSEYEADPNMHYDDIDDIEIIED